MTHSIIQYGRQRGMTLVEMIVALSVGMVIMFGAIALVDMSNSSVVQAQRDHRIVSDLEVILHGIGIAVRQGVQTEERQFDIHTTYSSFRSSGSPVADGTAGECLFVPYDDEADDIVIHTQGGQLIVESVADENDQSVLVAKEASGLSFTAEKSGAAPSRTGAVITSITLTADDGNVTLETIFLPRNR